MRELAKKSPRCPGCGAAAAASTEEQQLRLENAMLKAEVRSRAPRHHVATSFLALCAWLQISTDTHTVTVDVEYTVPCHSGREAARDPGNPRC